MWLCWCNSRINAKYSYTLLGDLTLLNVLTMLMLGATFYRLGSFNVFGTIIGAILVNIINNGMVMIGATTWQSTQFRDLIC